MTSVSNGEYSQKSFLKDGSKPVPTYPLLPIENPAIHILAVPAKSALIVQLLAIASYSQKSFNKLKALSIPVPTYPLLPIEKPTAPPRETPPTLAFCVHISEAGLYSQKSL